MKYKLKYVAYFGKDPNQIAITKQFVIDFDDLEQLGLWIDQNMLSQSIWWISYQIFYLDLLIKEKCNPNLDENFKSR